MRRIVLTRGHEPLEAAWQARSFSPAAGFLADKLRFSGLQLDQGYHPARVPGASRFRAAPASALGFSYAELGRAEHDDAAPAAYVIRADFENDQAIQSFRREHTDEILGVFADPTIHALPGTYCGHPAVGTAQDVARALGNSTLRNAGLTGRGVRVAVVDTGIDKNVVPVKGGWGPDPGYVPGSVSPPQHGTMCAWDVRITAPDADILDYALLQSTGPGWTGFLSDAIRAFADLMQLLQTDPGPLVVNNSWGMFDRSEDAPIGSPENYSANPNHPFNQIVGTLVASGADVCFAAGNCGGDCPDGRCGADDRGPGKSIHGANSHPDVLTVAAVTIDHRRLGYASQGPGGLSNSKPDVAGYSHFNGSGVFAPGPDSGTSAASPVVAGVLAALRQVADATAVPPASLKGLVQRTCKDINGTGWDFDLGYGVVNAVAAFQMLPGKARPATHRL